MNMSPGKNHKSGIYRAIDLKTPAKRSHNKDSCDERMIALVRFLARCAAEEDYRMYQDAHRPPDK